MSAVYSDNLKRMVQLYTNDDSKIVDDLKKALKSTSADVRYSLIINVKGERFTNGSIFHRSARRNDVQMMDQLLAGFSGDQLRKVWALSSHSAAARTALHHAAWTGSRDAVNFLLERTEKGSIFDYLTKKDEDGDTALHDAASKGYLKIAEMLLCSVSPQQQSELLKVVNKKGQTAVDVLFTKHGVQKLDELKTDVVLANLGVLEATQNKELDEIKQKQAQMNRKQAEMDRKQAELDRKQVEMDRKQVEMDRKQAEMDRKQVEMDRKQVEMDGKLSQLNIYLKQTICTNDVEDQEHADAE